MITDKSRRKAARLVSQRAPLVRCFAPAGRSRYVLYAVSLKEHPGITKVGRAVNWERRRMAYANWNLSNGDAICREQIFTITEEYVDLAKLEKALLESLQYERRHGYEWLVAEFDEVVRAIDRFLCGHGVSYL